MKLKHSIATLIIPFILLFSGCGGGDGGGDNSTDLQLENNGALIQATKISTTKPSVGIYSVNSYKIAYVTTHPKMNIKIKASGLLIVPIKDADKRSPILSYQHATLFTDDNIPTNSPSEIAQLGGRGFVVTAPDYISYGDSTALSPTYIHAESYVNAGLDLLRASKVFLEEQNIAINNQLFLAGYSEGGYATMAIQKAIQESYSDEFKVVASSAGAGPYDIVTTAKIVANKNPNEKPAFMSYVLKSYDDLYQLNDIENMYQSDYVNAVNTVFDGQHGGLTIAKNLTTDTSALFTPGFLSALKGEDGAGNFAIMDKLAENAIYDWAPTVPTMLFHGKNDETVPYENTQIAYSAMLSKGADIRLETCGEKIFGIEIEVDLDDTHVYCAVKYVLDTVDFFLGYDPELN